ESSMEPNTWGADGVPFVACRERFNFAHHGGTIDRRIAQPVAVSLGKYELPGGTVLTFINDPMHRDPAAREKSDDLSPLPRLFRPGADTDARAAGDRRSHAGAAHLRMDQRAGLAGYRTQSGQVVDCRRPGRARDKLAWRRCGGLLVHSLGNRLGRG